MNLLSAQKGRRNVVEREIVEFVVSTSEDSEMVVVAVQGSFEANPWVHLDMALRLVSNARAFSVHLCRNLRKPTKPEDCTRHYRN